MAKKAMTVILPPIIILFTTFLCVTSVFGLVDISRKALCIAAMLMVFPIVFFIQGIATISNKVNFIFTGVLTYLIMFFIMLRLVGNSYILCMIFNMVASLFGVVFAVED